MVYAKSADPNTGVVLRGVGVDDQAREFGGNVASSIRGSGQERPSSGGIVAAATTSLPEDIGGGAQLGLPVLAR